MRTPEEIKQYQKEYRQAHKAERRAKEALLRAAMAPEEKDALRAYKRQWVAKQPKEKQEKRLAYTRKYALDRAATRTDEERAKRTAAELERLKKQTPEQREKRLAGCRNQWRLASPEKRRHMLIQHKRWNEERWDALTEEERIVERARIALENRKRKLKRNFDLTIEEYDTLLQSQGGVCAICQLPPDWRALAVDHDHKTGLVRGILCYKCNVGIGMLNEDLVRIDRAATYLRASQVTGTKVL